MDHMNEPQTALVIPMTEAERARVEDLARRHGYETTSDYVRALIEQDEAVVTAEEDIVDIEAEFKQAWREAKAGNEVSLEDMWTMLDDE
jgi:hypothetical protein